MNERQLEKKCVAHIRQIGGLVRKLDLGPVSKGMIDCAVWLPDGLHLLIEFKMPDKKPTPLQDHTIDRFQRRGFTVWVIHSFKALQLLLMRVYPAYVMRCDMLGLPVPKIEPPRHSVL